MKKKWYVLCVEPGKDKMLRTLIPKEARRRGIKGIGRILIITHPEERWRKDKWVTMNIKSFPGYLILHMKYSDDIYILLEDLRIRGVWGLLPIRPEKPTPPKSRHGIEGKGPAWMKYEDALFHYINWKPTAVDTKEMAILMIREKDKHARKKDKKVPVRLTCDLKEGDKVKVIRGSYENLEAKVKKVRQSQIDFFITLEGNLLGRTFEIGVSHKDLERV